MKQVNDKIKSFDFKNIDLNQLYSDFKSADKVPALIITIPKGRAVYRCRRNLPVDELYYFEKDISYRTDLKNIKSTGRANHPHSSKFYGSLSTTTEGEKNLQGFALSIFETSEMWRDDKEGHERFTAGMWELKEDLRAFVVIPDKENKEVSALNKELIDEFEKVKHELKLTTDQIEFTELIGKEFSKKIKNGESNKYAISSTFAENILAMNLPAIAYPSVQSDMKGFNVVMNPNTADSYLTLKRAMVADFYKFKKNALLNYAFVTELKNNYPFHWENVPKEIGADLETIIQKFNSDEITSTYIISRLLNQSKGLK